MDSIRPIRALARGLEALTVLNLRDGATVTEVAQEIRLPRTTAYRILETLCDSGVVFRDSSDERYRLTLHVRGLSAGFEDESWVTQIAKPCLFELGDSVVWPVQIATSLDTMLLIREATDHRSPLAIEPVSVGTRIPLLTTSAGRAYLAHCGDARQAEILETLRRSKKQEDGLARDPAELTRLLVEIRSQGYACATHIHQPVEELSISLPVPLDSNSPAVLSVKFAASAVPMRSAVERFLPKLRQCAAKISTMYTQKQADARKRLPRSMV